MSNYWKQSPRRCSYCNSLEHDKRRCHNWGHDFTIMKAMVISEIDVYIRSLVESRFVPTSIVQLKNTDAYTFDQQEGRWVWSATGSGDVLFSLERRHLSQIHRPFNLSNGYYSRLKEWEVIPVNAMFSEDNVPNAWHRTTLSSDDIFEKPTHLITARHDLERCVLSNSYSENREDFVKLMKNLLTSYRDMVVKGETYRLKTEKVEVVSSVDKDGAEDYYRKIHYHLQKNSIDKFAEEWYKHYNSKIKDNHFQK